MYLRWIYVKIVDTSINDNARFQEENIRHRGSSYLASFSSVLNGDEIEKKITAIRINAHMVLKFMSIDGQSQGYSICGFSVKFPQTQK